MELYIAEKPSVGKALGAELGVINKSDGFITCRNDVVVTWCFGHLLELEGPDVYTPDDVPRGSSGRKIWRIDELPIIPTQWKMCVKDDAKKQLATIGKLLRQCTSIVNAGDPDREGQLLVDEVLEHFENQKPVKRIWLSAQDPVSVQRALKSLRSNTEYKGWADAARGRARADWLIGMNLSRAYTLRAQRGGTRALLTVGRVQTPTLALVVARDREIESFKPTAYHNIRITVQHSNGAFKALWIANENQVGLDSDGHLTDTAIADAIVDRVNNQSGTLTDYTQEGKVKPPRLGLALSDVTALASAQYGYTAEQVLTACQALYETHKLTSYPRTDCPYLPESQHADASAVIAAIRSTYPDVQAVIADVDVSRRSRIWNDAKITAHHAIVPTQKAGQMAALDEVERNVYVLIAKSYIAQFMPAHEYQQTDVSVTINGESFKTRGRVVTVPGWTLVFGVDDDTPTSGSDDDQALPKMQSGDQVLCVEAKRQDGKTKPPPRYTEGTLIRAMESIHKHVASPEHRKLLRETDGIGTSATRASILSELRRRQFLEAKGKAIVSTELGRSAIDALPESVKSPVLTALFERVLADVEAGSADLTSFLARQEKYIRDQVAKANDGAVTIAGGIPAAPVSDVFRCQSCGTGLSRRQSKTKPGRWWWGCSNFPKCTATYKDVKGRPGAAYEQKEKTK